MHQRYPVKLTDSERDSRKWLIAAGTAPARKLAHARMLLKADEGWTAAQIVDAVDISQPTISRAPKHFVDEGLEAARNRRTTRRVYRPKLDGEQEAGSSPSRAPSRRRAKAIGPCASWPTRRSSWRSPTPSRTRPCAARSKNALRPHLVRQWVIPPEHSGEFVWHRLGYGGRAGGVHPSF